MKGLEEILEHPRLERLQMFVQFKHLRGVMLEAEHIQAGAEMIPVYCMSQCDIRNNCHLNHRQYDEVFKLVKDNYYFEPAALDRELRSKYGA